MCPPAAPTRHGEVTCDTLEGPGERTRMTARTAPQPPLPPVSWPPGLPRSLDYPAVPVGLGAARGRAPVGRPAGVHRGRRPADATPSWAGARTRWPTGWPTTASAGATSSRCTRRTAGSTRRSTTACCWPAPRSPPPTRCCPRPTWPPSSPTPAPGCSSPGTRCCPSSAAPWPSTPVETVVVTGPAHTADFTARAATEPGDVDLADLLAADPTDRHLDAGVDPAGRPRAPGLHRRHDRGEQGRGADPPQRGHQRAAVRRAG